MAHDPHDHSYKLLFSHPEMVADLLRGYVREPWVEQLDFATLTRVNDGYVSDDLREREDDIVWRIRWRGDGDQWLYVYLLLDEGCFADQPLAAHNVVSALFTLENSRAPADIQRVLDALLTWLTQPEQKSLRRSFTVWLKRVLLPARMPGVNFEQVHELREVRSMLEERVKEWTRDWEQQGIQKGIEQGRQAGEATLLLRQIELKFGSDAATASRASIEAADAETLLLWSERILTAERVEEIFV